jgi:hypothetical protein
LPRVSHLRGEEAVAPGETHRERLLHKACAAIAVDHCPKLKRDVREGILGIREMLKFDVRMSYDKPESIAERFVSGFMPVGKSRIVGYVEVLLVKARLRSLEWLNGAAIFGVTAGQNNPRQVGQRRGPVSPRVRCQMVGIKIGVGVQFGGTIMQ